MEAKITNQINFDYIRREYYYEILEDLRNVFIDFGRHLQKKNIEGYGSIDEYENFLISKEVQDKELEVYNEEKKDTTIKDYFESLPQKEIERMDFEDFLLECISWENDVILIKGADWDEFYSTDDEDYEMKIEYTDGVRFYEKFKEITGLGLTEFDECFVSAKYIDEWTYNTINLIVNINAINQRFVVDRV